MIVNRKGSSCLSFKHCPAMLFGLLLVAVVMSSSNIARSDTLTLTTVKNSPDSFLGEVIVKKTYAKLGIEVTILRYPAERALRSANQGAVDGEVQRIGAIAKIYPNLIRIEPAINSLEAGVFTIDSNFAVEGWESVRPYKIGIIRGIKFAERGTEGMRRDIVGDYQSLFRMIQNKRFDIAVIPRFNGIYQQKRLGFKGIRELTPPIEKHPLYHYLHKKHADLVPEISAVLNEMNQSGELAAIHAQVNKVLFELAENGKPVCKVDYSCFGISFDQ